MTGCVCPPGGGHGYERDPSDGSDADVDEARVNRLLEERVAAKRAREYDKADGLRDELRAMGIEVNDKDRCWRVRGGRGRDRGQGDDRGRKRGRESESRGGSFANDGSFLQEYEAEASHEGSVRQRRGGESDGDRRRRDRDRPADDGRGADGAAPFRKPSAALDPSKMLDMLQSVAGDADGGQEEKRVPAETCTSEDANKLAAEAVRAKLMGDMARHDKLMAKLERVKQSSGSDAGREQSAAGGAAPRATAASTEEVVIISELDADGKWIVSALCVHRIVSCSDASREQNSKPMSRPCCTGRPRVKKHKPVLPGNQRGHDRDRVDTRLKAGERRERFFADDDVSLDELVARERKEGRQAKYDAHYADNISRNKQCVRLNHHLLNCGLLASCSRQCHHFICRSPALMCLGLRRATIPRMNTEMVAPLTQNTRNDVPGRQARTMNASSNEQSTRQKSSTR